MPPIKFQLNPIYGLGGKDFQDGRHGSRLGCWNGTILAILNLHVATMPPTNYQLNPTYSSGGDVENVKS